MKKAIFFIASIILFSCDKDDSVKYLLTTSANPEDSGTVLPSTRQYNDGDTAKLIASPAEGYLFESWTGATGDAHTDLVMVSDKTVVGNFAKIKFDLTKPDGMPRKVLNLSLLNELGWKSRINLSDGIRSLYAWYKNQNHYIIL